MHVVVLGAGSLGSLLGGLLARTHEVTLVGRGEHVSTVQERGLRVTGAIDASVRPTARTSPPAIADVALVTVKAYDTEDAARILARCDLRGVCSLQNGMGNEAVLADALDVPVLAGTCTYGARLAEPGVVECTGSGEVALGHPDGGRSTLADEVGDAFTAAAVETVVAEDMPRRLWEKLAVNAGINAPTALARVRNGALADGPGNEVALAAAQETARVARQQGIDLSDDRAASLSESVAAETAPNHSSMLQDVRAGSRTEIDAINGYVVERATDSVPVNATLANLVRAWERANGLR